MSSAERTYIMVKPDGVQRGVVGDIIGRFERKGYSLRGLKLTTPPQDLLEEHYRDLKDKGFFPKLMGYMTSGPVVAMVWEGKGVVATGRKMLGATNPLESAPGTIRGDFCIDVGRNICHGSDSVESAEREIALWFKEGLETYEPHNGDISTSSQGSSSGRRDGNQGTDGILVLSLKELKPNVISQTMERVCAHIGVPAFDLEDSKAKVRSIYIYY